MQVIPAIDVRGGRCVRLLQGDFARETVYEGDPLDVARRFAAAGARRLHLVDLDAARGSEPNSDLLARIVGTAGLEVQVGGGVRGEPDVRRWLDAGAAAVVMGTTAVREPDLLRACAAAHPGRVMAALDVRAGEPAVTGWTATEAIRLEALLGRWEPAGLAAVILTSIDRDGTLAGPDLDSLRRVLALTRHPVLYSGGVGSSADVSAVAAAGAAGVILGKALHEGRLSLQDALAAA